MYQRINKTQVFPVPHAFSLRCLGSPSLVTVAGEPVRFRTRKHLALLIRMALEPGKQFTRDYLTDLLWPSAAPRLANHSLAQGLSVIKAKIARAAVVIQRATVGLAAGWVEMDIHRLGDGSVAINGPFLDAFDIPAARPFEDWKDEYRARLIPQLRDCLVRQMDAARRIGDFPTVEQRAGRLQEIDPLAEEAIRGIMEARAWASDRSNALKAFARYEAQLAEELGAKPGADLVRMADLLRDGRRSPPRPPVAGAAPPRVDRRFEPETLIGREREFSVLFDAWLDSRRKSPRIVVVTGDPGVGKTTLTNAFVSSCQMDGAVVARAQAYDAERELPFAVLGELVKQLAAQRAIGSADPEALSELTRISTEIVRVFPGVPKPVEWSPELTPLRLADAFLKTVTAAAEDSPVVLVVDDIHAADNASTAILHVVARKLIDVRVLMIFAGRTSELRLSGAPAALTSDHSIEGLRALEVDVLPAEAAERLVRQLAGAAGHTDAPTARILRASGGNPLAIEFLTREWAAHGPGSLLHDLEALDTQPVPALGIPRAIAAVFERQSRRLDPVTHATLDLAAVLGRRLTDVGLYAAVELSAGQAAEALSRLKDEGLLREVRGDLEFRNELIRAQAYYAVAGPVRQHLHRRIGQLLATRHPQKDSAFSLEIAWHCWRGDQQEEALLFGMAGAEHALAAGAPAEAQRILEALLQSCTQGNSVQRMQILLANALLDRSEANKAMPVLDALNMSASLTPRECAEVTRLLSTAEFLMASSSSSRRLAAAEAALDAARRTGDPELTVRALLERARTYKLLGDLEGMTSTRDEVARIVNDDSVEDSAFAYLTLAYCDYHLNQLESALNSMQRVADLDGRNLAQLAFVNSGIGTCYYMLCDFAKASAYLHQGLEIAQRLGDDSRCSRILANLIVTETTLANYDNAIRLGRQSIDLARRNPAQPELVTAYTNLADAYLLTGQPELASESLEKAREWVTSHDDWQMTVAFLCEHASWAMTTANVGLALSTLGEIERVSDGRERFIIHGGLMAKLQVLRAAYEDGPEAALRIAEERRRFFRSRVPLYHLDAVAACAWAEKRCKGAYSEQTTEELQLFTTLGALGKRALLQAQGFLS